MVVNQVKFRLDGSIFFGSQKLHFFVPSIWKHDEHPLDLPAVNNQATIQDSAIFGDPR
jgi:hypothetical protein